tara:strand:- start:10899 stop:11750 length:852 start_codon:yes stop_codon:yes gene_type:complete
MSELKDYSKVSIQREAKIHPLAEVSSEAELASGVVIGPGSVIGPDVRIGEDTIVGANVILEGKLIIGNNNRFFPGACIGLEPQDLKYKGAPTEVVIGNKNTFRECVTINRATDQGEQTVIGDGCLLMAYCHVAHNCNIGDGVVMSNSVQVAGHVLIEDKAVIGGCVGIHQFVHIGTLSMVGGMSRVDRDVPPYCLIEGNPSRMRGLNIVGIRRSDLDIQNPGALHELQETWKLIYRSGHVLKAGLELAKKNKMGCTSQHLCDFLEASSQKGRRGPMPLVLANK